MRATAILVWLSAISACVPAAPSRAASLPAPSARALYERGLRHAALGAAARAERDLVRALHEGQPPDAVIVPLVRVCIALGRLHAGLAYAEPFLGAHPDAIALRYLVVAIRLALNQPEPALLELRRIVREQPNAAQAHYLLAVTLRDAVGDDVAARASFETYLRLAPAGAHADEAASWLAEHPARPSERPAPIAAVQEVDHD